VIVVDTSVWIDHIRGIPTPLTNLFGQGRIGLHPFVMGELLLNGLPRNSQFASDLADLPEAPSASPSEVAAFIVWAKLTSNGVGYVDAHLLVSATLTTGSVMTNDKNLVAQAERLGIAYLPRD
jgi:predicted nucleic acid-binding protein